MLLGGKGASQHPKCLSWVPFLDLPTHLKSISQNYAGFLHFQQDVGAYPAAPSSVVPSSTVLSINIPMLHEAIIQRFIYFIQRLSFKSISAEPSKMFVKEDWMNLHCFFTEL